jgi:molybdopterin-containing oxidoreductase family membrane subunit
MGAFAVIRVMLHGHETIYAVNREVPWGLLIATYAYFVITSTGLAFIGGLGHAFGFEKFARMNRRIVMLAFVTLLAGFTQIGMELGHPFRLMIYFLVSPHFAAPIVWMGLFYSIELVLLAVELFIIFQPERFSRRTAALVGFLALVVGVIATSNLGFVFGSINARPFFHGIYFPVFLVVSGIVAGAGLLLIVYNVVYRFRVPAEYVEPMRALGRLMGLGIGGMVLLYFWKIMSSLYTEPQGAYESAMALLSGPLAPHFWIGEVLLALAVPLALLIVGLRRVSTTALGLSGLVFLLGMFFTRFDFIVAGQLPPMREGYEGSGVHTVNGLAQYAPSMGEWMIFALGLGVFFFLYFMAEKFLDLESADH